MMRVGLARARPAIAALALAPALLAPICCTRRASQAPRRLAVLRFENLSPDAADGWMGRAFQEILDAELEGAPDVYAISSSRLLAMDRALGARPVAAPGISTEQAAALSTGATRIGYGEYTVRGTRVEARLSLADPQTGKTVAAFDAGAGDVIAAAGALARRISPAAQPYTTNSLPALRAYVEALEAGTPAEAVPRAEAAVATDPGFAPAARLLAGLKLAQGDRAGGIECLNRALARAAQMPAAEQARLRLEVATLENQAAARRQALAVIAAAEPANPEAWIGLGNAAFGRREYGAAQQAFHKAADLDPQQPAALNQEAYAAAFGGHLDEAIATLKRYQAVKPSDPNPIDSMGDVQLLAGHAREAEPFYVQAAKLDPHFLNGGDWLKAAMAGLMAGDVAGADALSENYARAHFPAGSASSPVYRAQWRFLSGRRREAYAEMEALAHLTGDGAQRAVAGEASAQLAIWDLYLGDRATASAHARAAMGAGQAAVLAEFLSGPPASAGEWSARAEKLAPRPEQSGARDFVLAQALLLGGYFDAALPVLSRTYDAATPTDPEPPVLLAWAYLETGQTAGAAAVLKFLPIPEPTGIDAFEAGWFPRVFYLKAEAAEKLGRMDEARADYTLFLKLSGDLAFHWGEEAKAKEKTAGK